MKYLNLNNICVIYPPPGNVFKPPLNQFLRSKPIPLAETGTEIFGIIEADRICDIGNPQFAIRLHDGSICGLESYLHNQ